MEGAAGLHRTISRRVAAHRPRATLARQPGGRAAAGTRARIPALETRHARRLALEPTLIYAPGRRWPVQPHRARIRARTATPAEPRQAPRRAAAFPEAGTRSTRPRACPEGARRDGRETERGAGV